MKTLRIPEIASHEPLLPQWGPYSKKYFGVSQVADAAEALRFDAFLMPQLLRRKRELPDALRPCGLIPDHAAEDLSQWSCSWQLDEAVSARITFQLLPEGDGALIECVLNNSSGRPADAALHLFAQMFAEVPVKLQIKNALALCEPELPAGRGLEFDTLRPHEFADPNVYNGSFFQFAPGEKVSFDLPEHLLDKRFFMRCRTAGVNWHFREIKELEFTATEHILINILAVCEKDANPEFVQEPVDALAQMRETTPRKLVFEYPSMGKDCVYSISASEDMTFHRRYAVDNLVEFFQYRDMVQQPFFAEFYRQGSGVDQALDWVVQPLHIPGKGSIKRAFTIRRGKYSDMAQKQETRYLEFNDPCRLSCERLSAVTLTNVIYPVRICSKAVRHFTPGRLWNSLYTWDSGFIGLGLLEIAPQLAAEVLNSYLTREGDSKNAFVLHGTPLPVQIFLLQELWNCVCDKELLTALYPGVRQMYKYLAGHLPGSTTRSFCREAVIGTWDYFYNTGGWDDYPPQQAVHKNKLTRRVLPVVSTAILIRCARTLAALGKIIGLEDDPVYAEDIQAFTQALLKYSWDEESGYFGYICCDESGSCQGIYRTESGENFNRGLDGTSPLISGGFPEDICSRLWRHLESEDECMTPYGISTVDRSASYFREEGYWNGAIWMPHQWFLWKAALDAGKIDLAWKIARTALETYEKECVASGYCFEHFSTHSGWGGGWHHFSGLSTPILCWHEAYYGKKRFNGGFDTILHSFSEQNNTIGIELEQHGTAGSSAAVLLSLPARSAQYNGMELPVTRCGNASAVLLPCASRGKLVWQL